MDAHLDLLTGIVLESRFELERFVARGGYGVVYRARHLTLGCAVAVKVLDTPEHVQGAARERSFEAFRHEARTIAALRHPAIVGVYDAGIAVVDGASHPYIAMEWIEGETLEVMLRRTHGMGRSPRESYGLLRPLIEAIACAHEAGVVHRDLKPGNVMLSRNAEGVVRARVLDFGVAKVMESNAPGAEVIGATSDAFSPFSLTHAAPEQIGRLRTGPWTDVHALALLLVEVLVGQRALRGSNSVELFASITAQKRASPATFGVEVGPWEPLLQSALALLASERPRDAAALLKRLDETLDEAQAAWERPITLREFPSVERPSETPAHSRGRGAWNVGFAATTLGVLAALTVSGAPRRGAAPPARTALATAPASSLPAGPPRVGARPPVVAAVSLSPAAGSPLAGATPGATPARPLRRRLPASALPASAAPPTPAPPRPTPVQVDGITID